MKNFCRRLLSMALIAALTVPPHAVVHAEDTDLFAGGSSLSGANPNILFILDNSANWAAQSQHWTDASAQGQSELRALRTVVNGLNSSVNVGLMMLTAGTGSGKKDGSYVRFAVRPMSTRNKNALMELIGDENCADGANSLNGTPNCIFKNFSSGTLNESVGSNVDYSATLFEAFKYFGGYTNPANANKDAQPSGAVNDASHFGPYRYSGNPDGREDPYAYTPLDTGASTATNRNTYDPPVGSANNCAKNFIIFVGNGFPVQDAPSSLLTGLGGTATQLSMPKLSTTTGLVTTTLLNSTGNVCEDQATCATRAASLFPGKNTYSCTGGTTSSGTVNNLGTNTVCESAGECATRASNTFTSQYTNYACTGGTATTKTVTLTASSGVCESQTTCQSGTGAPARFPGYSGYTCTGGGTSSATVTLYGSGTPISGQASTGSVCETPTACQTRVSGLFPGYTNVTCASGTTSAGTTNTLEATTSVCETQAACKTRAANTYTSLSGSTLTGHDCTGGASSAGTTVNLYGGTNPLSGAASTGNTCETPTECQTRMSNLYPGYTSYSCINGNTITGQGGCTGQNRVNQTVTAISGACTNLVGQQMTAKTGVCGNDGTGKLQSYTNVTATSVSCPGAVTNGLIGMKIEAQAACMDSQTIQGTSGVCSSPNKINWTMNGTINAITVTDTGLYETPANNVARWADEWAKFLYTTDVNGATVDNVGFAKEIVNGDIAVPNVAKTGAAGRQNVKIYTLDVFKDAQDTRQTALLFNMAKAGGGSYYQASSEADILAAINAALIDIQATNTVFAAASLPVSATNRAQNENQVFFGLFRPDGGGAPRWYGNLKRYQVAQSTGGLVLADKDGNDAINNASGFFSPCATSFWSTDTSSYWSFSPDSAGQCSSATTNAFSDVPDGPLVEKGGAAEVLRLTNSSSPASRLMYTCASTASCSSMVAFSNSTVTTSALGAADDAERDLIVDYTKGYDVGRDRSDANYNLVTTDTRPSIHGDIVHSRPLPVNYGGGTGVVVYYGGNDGPLRAVKTIDGTELWSFIAPEHHAKLRRLRNNNALIAYPNVLAQAAAAAAAGTPMSPPPAAKDYFFDGTLGLYQTASNSAVWIFPTMRRGGRMLYAFNVTDPAAPALKWRKGCTSDSGGCDTGFEGIGQTWSTPNVALTKGYSSGATPMMVVGGGYDTCEDTDTKNPTCTSPKGNKVYVLNADTGAILASFNTDRSVPSDIALVDRDFDSLVDHAYVVDTGGNIYRIDFVHPTTLAPLSAPSGGTGSSCAAATSGDWCISKIAFTNSDTEGRKFQFPPAVFPSGTGEVILTLGTGDRERPLVGNYPYTDEVKNRFYMFRDKFPMTTGSPPVPAAATDLDDTTKLTRITDTSSTSTLCSAPLGWRFNLPGRGEQVVTSSLIAGGRVFFNTARAVTAGAGVCGADLGVAQGYNVSLLCPTDRISVVYNGGGLPISPVQGTTTLASGAVVTFVIGGPPDASATSPFTPGRVKPVVSPKRSRLFWYRHGDK